MMSLSVGQTQWFAFEEREDVARSVALLEALRITEFRALFSWADWERSGGPAWFDHFTGALAQVPGMRLLPVFFYTPPHLARANAAGERKTSHPPEDLSSYALFVREMVLRYGQLFDWVQLWNEPNWKPYWDWDLDPRGDLFAEMAIPAAQAAHELGKRVALGGTAPLDYAWYGRMHDRGLLRHVDAAAFHFAPSWDNQHRRWFPLETEIGALRAMLRGFGYGGMEVWLSECGISTNTTSDHDERKLERRQIDFFEEVRRLPVERLYWFCLLDQPHNTHTDDSLNLGLKPDLTAYHFGLETTAGRRKPLFAHWQALTV